MNTRHPFPKLLQTDFNTKAAPIRHILSGDRGRFNLDPILSDWVYLICRPSNVSTFFPILNFDPWALTPSRATCVFRDSSRQSVVVVGTMASTKRTANFTLVGLPSVV